VLALVSGCGGEVSVDSDAASCEAPAPIGDLLSCHGAVAVDEGTTTCSSFCLDEESHEYLSVCAGAACECWYQGARVCDCRDDERTTCRTDETCCPPPWL
jgi:hypothetical protein